MCRVTANGTLSRLSFVSDLQTLETNQLQILEIIIMINNNNTGIYKAPFSKGYKAQEQEIKKKKKIRRWF